MNPIVERLFEYDREELVGESIDRLVPDAAQRTHAAHRASYLKHPRTRRMGSGLELRGRQRSGAEFPVEISLSPVRTGERTLVIAIVRDVTERREADEELTRARNALALGDERERIARDLHDTVIQRVFAVGLSLQATVARAGSSPALERIHETIDDIDQTIRDLRSTIFALHARRAGTAGVRDNAIAIAHEAARVLGFEPAVAFDGPVDSAATDPIKDTSSQRCARPSAMLPVTRTRAVSRSTSPSARAFSRCAYATTGPASATDPVRATGSRTCAIAQKSWAGRAR